MNDKRACQYLLVPYVLWQLADGEEDVKCKRIKQYVELLAANLIPEDKKRFKLSKRVFDCTKSTLEFIANEGKYSGHKVVLILYYLTQIVFDSKDGLNIKEHHFKAMRRIHFILDYVLELEAKDRANRLSDEEFELLNKSAKRQAKKIYELFYKTI